jgi:hypothetical protein
LDFQIRTYDTGSPGGSVYIDGASLTTGTPPSELIESFNTYPPSQWIELDLGITDLDYYKKEHLLVHLAQIIIALE